MDAKVRQVIVRLCDALRTVVVVGVVQQLDLVLNEAHPFTIAKSITETRALLAKETCSTEAFRCITWMLPREHDTSRTTLPVSDALILSARPGYPSQETQIV